MLPTFAPSRFSSFPALLTHAERSQLPVISARFRFPSPQLQRASFPLPQFPSLPERRKLETSTEERAEIAKNWIAQGTTKVAKKQRFLF